jgi:spermidine synthase
MDSDRIPVSPLLLVLLAASGCAALIYEIVWFQLLQLVIGSSAVSLGLLLAAYMGGLCLGSVALPRLVSRDQHPLRVYGVLEIGIAIFGILTLFGLPLISRVYIAGATQGLLGLVMRGAVAAACLLPPTILMGASFPAVARWAEATPRGVSWLGSFYSANIAGAVFGALLSGFYLLRVYDMATATYTAAAINIAVAIAALTIGAVPKRKSPPFEGGVPASLASRQGGLDNLSLEQTTPSAPSAQTPLLQKEGIFERARGFALVYVVIALSGLTALGAEVVWTRLLSLLLGATVYTFSIILAVFLLGLWLGSAIGSFLVRRIQHPRLVLAGTQVLLAAAIAGTAYTLTFSLPFWPVDPWLSLNPWFTFDLDVIRCMRAIFPATLLWGASFPIALACAAAEGEDPAKLSGEVYAANTAGSILGALAFSLILIPDAGTRGSQQLLIGLAIAAAGVAVVAHFWKFNAKLAVALAGSAVVAWALISTVADVPWQAIAYGRRVAPILRGLDPKSEAMPVFVGEGVNSSVVITRRGEQRFFYVSGKNEASSALLDMRLQRMMGHLPALIHPQPKSVLVVGFGAGVTAGSFVPNPDVESITICELESIIPPASNEFFGVENYNVLHDSRTRMVYDDARHFILTTPDKFDLITTDPIHPWVKGTSSLYSREYFELIRSHLNTGGVAAQWLPLYESDEETVKTQLATFFSVFPNGTVWSNYLNGDGYDLVLIGRADDSPIKLDEMQQRLTQPKYARVLSSLSDVDIHSASDLLSTYAGRALDLAPMLSDAPINRDLNMRLQYIAGWGVNSVMADPIYRQILSYRRFPGDLITGKGEAIEALEDVIGRKHRTF